MESAITVIKIIFLVGLLLFIVFSALMVLVIWRFSLSKTAPIFLTVMFALGAFTILSHAFYLLTRI